MKNDKWTKLWEKWDDGEGWTLIVMWSGVERGSINCYGETKALAIADFKNKIAMLNILSEKIK